MGLCIVALWGCTDGKDTAPEWTDADGDGYYDYEDCDDQEAAAHPGADEYCDGIDNNCNDVVDEQALDALLWYEDADGDGYGAFDSTQAACEKPEGYVDNGDDCLDADAGIHPEADEICDELDNDCDGLIDDGDDDTLGSSWYLDADNDAFGDRDALLVICEDPSDLASHYVLDDQDCMDTSSAVHPGAESICDGVTNDCDLWVMNALGELVDTFDPAHLLEGELIDEDGDDYAACIDCDDEDPEVEDYFTFYADEDGDGFGDVGHYVEACEPPVGYLEDSSDCDDTDERTHPAAFEFCTDGVDNDCDSLVDDDDDQCPCGDVHISEGGVALRFCTGLRSSYSVAGMLCEALDEASDWDLYQPQTSAEALWATELAWDYAGSDWWLATTDVATEGVWELPYNDDVVYDHSTGEIGEGYAVDWMVGEPNDAGGEDCAVFRSADGEWLDVNCTANWYPVCKQRTTLCSGGVVTSEEDLSEYEGCTDIIDDFEIDNLPTATDLAVLADLRTVDGDFKIKNNSEMTRLTGLERLSSVSGQLLLNGNSELVDVTALYSLTSAGRLYIGYNDKLPNLVGLDGLSSVGDIFIGSNSALTSIGTLPLVTEMSYLLLTNNDALEVLDGPVNLTTLTDYLQVSGNAELLSIDGLASVTDVASNLTLSDNPKLCQTVVNAKVSSITYGGSLDDDDNDDGC